MEKRKNRIMETLRKPLQGVFNIVRFNWHFYIFSAFFIFGLLVFKQFFSIDVFVMFTIGFIIITTTISLLVSFYIYDLSSLYDFNWILKSNENLNIVTINAGFDETSLLLKAKFKNSKVAILDFYNPEKHTEISIERARKAYPSQPDTIQIETSNIALETNSVDIVFLIFAAHEIRNNQERVIFFKEINRILKQNGQVFVLEHLRDFNNFCAYSIGFFHFLTRPNWKNTFDKSNFTLDSEQKQTLFISLFTLSKNGNPS